MGKKFPRFATSIPDPQFNIKKMAVCKIGDFCSVCKIVGSLISNDLKSYDFN